MKRLVADETAVRRKTAALHGKAIRDLGVKSGVSKPAVYDRLNGKTPLSERNPREVFMEAEDAAEEKDVSARH